MRGIGLGSLSRVYSKNCRYHIMIKDEQDKAGKPEIIPVYSKK